MSTTEKPGRFDCLQKLASNEPYFVLRAQDQEAADLVELWAIRAKAAGCKLDKVNEAFAIAEEMRAWPRQKAPD
jgi:hypothetical protein